MLKNLLFLAAAKRSAAKRAAALLNRAIGNPQFSEDGALRARIEFNLGRLHARLGRKDEALTYLRHSRDAALAQEATALLAKIDSAMAAL